MRMDKRQLLSPAKINLSLTIEEALPCSIRSNEMLHTLLSTFISIPIYDEIVVEKIARKKIEMFFSGPYSKGIPNNDHNSIYRAAKLFFTETGFSEGIRIHVVKNIPLASGLGGASSNAATILIALIRIFPEKSQKIGIQRWREMCLSLGSDVPFFFSEENVAEVSGFGEKIKKISFPFSKPIYGVVAMLPKIAIKTPWAYETLDSFRKKGEREEKGKNDFEPCIFFHFPNLEKLRDNLLSFGALQAGLTGSGGAIFALFEEKKNSLLAEQKIRSKCEYWKTFEII